MVDWDNGGWEQVGASRKSIFRQFVFINRGLSFISTLKVGERRKYKNPWKSVNHDDGILYNANKFNNRFCLFALDSVHVNFNM